MEKQLIDFKKYVETPIRVTKLQDNRFHGQHPGGFNEGHVEEGTLDLENSNQYQTLFIITSPTRYFHTSQVRRIEEHEGYDLITTLNSVYKVEPIFSGLTGTQEKHLLKLEDQE